VKVLPVLVVAPFDDAHHAHASAGTHAHATSHHSHAGPTHAHHAHSHAAAGTSAHHHVHHPATHHAHAATVTHLARLHGRRHVSFAHHRAILLGGNDASCCRQCGDNQHARYPLFDKFPVHD